MSSSGTLALAVEEAKKLHNTYPNLFAAIVYLAKLENPADLEANIKRLKAQSTELIANMRKEAEAQVERDSKGKVEAAERKSRTILKEAEDERTRLVNQGQAQANQIIADARKAGEKLAKQFEEAHKAAHAAIR